jgi:hypothetical protein
MTAIHGTADVEHDEDHTVPNSQACRCHSLSNFIVIITVDVIQWGASEPVLLD